MKDGKLTKEQRDALVAKSTQWLDHEIAETHDGHGGFGKPGGDGPPPSDGNGTGSGGQNGGAPSGTSCSPSERACGGAPTPGGAPPMSQGSATRVAGIGDDVDVDTA